MNRSMSIQEISDRTGLPKSTLRYWEKEFDGIIVPARTPGGQRRYQPHHIELFSKISMFKQEGKSIQEIRHLFSSTVDTANGLQGTQCTSVEMLAQRIAELVSEEVNRFLSGQERSMHRKQGINK